MNTSADIFDEIVYAYTRAQALADGQLIEVTDEAKKAGFKTAVDVTRAVWDQYIEWTEKDSDQQTYQNQSGRLWDVLWMLRASIGTSKNSDTIVYKLHVVPRDGKRKKPKLIQLKSVIGGSDNGEPIITIMLPGED